MAMYTVIRTKHTTFVVTNIKSPKPVLGPVDIKDLYSFLCRLERPYVIVGPYPTLSAVASRLVLECADYCLTYTSPGTWTSREVALQDLMGF